jgi:uncharacterized membrane protein
MNNQKSLLVRFVGLALVTGGLTYFYFSLSLGGLIPDYRQYLPKPWKVFVVLTGAWMIYSCYLNWEAVSKRLESSFGVFVVPQLKVT